MNRPRNDNNDPTPPLDPQQELTAYALGEIADPEASQIRDRLEANSEEQAFVTATQECVTDLAQAFAEEPEVGLEPAQRERIETALASRKPPIESPKSSAPRPPAHPVRKSRWLKRLGSFAAVAASLLFVAMLLLPELTAVKEKRSYSASPPATLSGYLGLRDKDNAAPFRGPGAIDQLDPLSRERYARIVENPFIRVATDPLSTFSVDVDTASYANVRRFLNDGTVPPPDSVRVEEMINYFRYDYEGPEETGDPFATHVEISDCPWNDAHRLVRIGLQGRKIALEKRPAMNLVFLLDVSGSMISPHKLPLLLRSLQLLVPTLTENDRVAIVVYAGNAGLVLPSTAGDRHRDILDALNQLRAGGSTAGGQGIQLAYRVAAENFIQGGVNRVLLATDGDFNVGVSDTGSLTRLVEEKARSHIFLSVLGFGRGNLNDSMMEEITNRGNGNYSYIDSLNEAKKVLIEQASGTFVTIAKDVKIQVEFNPAQVAAYRLIGYENRMLAHQDFDDDRKDAGEIGAGHSVTALYEVVPTGIEPPVAGTKPLKYQAPRERKGGEASKELLTLKLRYKEPEGAVSRLLEIPVVDPGDGLSKSSDDFRFAASVAGFGMLLRGSKYSGDLNHDAVHRLARGSLGEDSHGYRAEFLGLVRKAQGLSGKR